MFKEFADGFPYNDISGEIESMTHLLKRLIDKNFIKVYFDFHAIEGLTGNIKWSNGQLIYKSKFEVMLYHLLELKKVFHPENSGKTIPDVFRISTSRIYC